MKREGSGAVQWLRPANMEGLFEQVVVQPVQRPWGGPMNDWQRSSREAVWYSLMWQTGEA